jgi:hypothetical protein
MGSVKVFIFKIFCFSPVWQKGAKEKTVFLVVLIET